MDDKIYTVPEVQEMLGISRTYAYRLVKEGKIEAFRVGKSWRITESALQAFISEHSNRRGA